MDELSKYEIYKIATQDNTESYIFSIETNDNDERYIYYLIRFNNQNKPVIERVSNALALLETTNIKIQKVKNNEELRHFFQIIEAIKNNLKISPHSPKISKIPYTRTIKSEDKEFLKINKN